MTCPGTVMPGAAAAVLALTALLTCRIDCATAAAAADAGPSLSPPSGLAADPYGSAVRQSALHLADVSTTAWLFSITCGTGGYVPVCGILGYVGGRACRQIIELSNLMHAQWPIGLIRRSASDLDAEAQGPCSGAVRSSATLDVSSGGCISFLGQCTVPLTVILPAGCADR